MSNLEEFQFQISSIDQWQAVDTKAGWTCLMHAALQPVEEALEIKEE
jgi:hypothetical protein